MDCHYTSDSVTCVPQRTPLIPPMLFSTILTILIITIPLMITGCLLKLLLRRAATVLGWWDKLPTCSDINLQVAAALEIRGNEPHASDLLDALEAEGTIADETHVESASQAYHQQDAFVSKHFYKVWIAAVRLEFPLRSNRPSDRACMTKWLAGQMRAKGVRVTHIEDAVPRIVAIALNPSRAEVEAEEMATEADLWRLPAKATWIQRWLGCAPRRPEPRKWE